jgi:tRNA(Arg) A34 adenosine deaminase TadA
MENDRMFLRKAVETALEGILIGGGPFGAVITKDNKIISSSFNRVVLNNDPTAHAEVLAIREASSILKTHDLKECTLYTSCEPCPMCLGAIYWAGISKVVYALDRNDAKNAGFNDKLIYDELMAEPGSRKISFIRLKDPDGEKIFTRWDNLENKIPY